MRGGMNGGMNWEQEWRTRVTDQLDEIAERQQTASVIQERVLGILNAYDDRIKALESQPDKQRATLFGMGNLGMSAVYALISLAALAISLGSHLSFH